MMCFLLAVTSIVDVLSLDILILCLLFYFFQGLL